MKKMIFVLCMGVVPFVVAAQTSEHTDFPHGYFSYSRSALFAPAGQGIRGPGMEEGFGFYLTTAHRFECGIQVDQGRSGLRHLQDQYGQWSQAHDVFQNFSIAAGVQPLSTSSFRAGIFCRTGYSNYREARSVVRNYFLTMPKDAILQDVSYQLHKTWMVQPSFRLEMDLFSHVGIALEAMVRFGPEYTVYGFQYYLLFGYLGHSEREPCTCR